MGVTFVGEYINIVITTLSYPIMPFHAVNLTVKVGYFMQENNVFEAYNYVGEFLNTFEFRIAYVQLLLPSNAPNCGHTFTFTANCGHTFTFTALEELLS